MVLVIMIDDKHPQEEESGQDRGNELGGPVRQKDPSAEGQKVTANRRKDDPPAARASITRVGSRRED